LVGLSVYQFNTSSLFPPRNVFLCWDEKDV
jgi:hypothetical protein